MPHNPSGFAERILARNAIIYDLRVTIRGDARYYIIQIKPAMHKAFLKAVKDDAGFRLEDYGDILYRGLGEPPEALKKELREKYGMYDES